MTTKELIRIMNHNLDMLRYDFNAQMDAMRKVMEEAWLGRVHLEPKKVIQEEPAGGHANTTWSEDSKKLLASLVNKGASYKDLEETFPGRTRAGISYQISMLRAAGSVPRNTIIKKS